MGKIKSGETGTPTSFVRVICKNSEITEDLIQNGILLGNRKFPVVAAKKQTRVLQCYNCQAFGHHSTDCKDQTYCGKCSGKHKTRECTFTKTHCANCQKSHPTYSTTCQVFQQELTKQKQKQLEHTTKQQGFLHSTGAIGTGSWASIVKKQSQQTTTDIQKITTESQEETKKLISENEVNIKTTISESLADLKTQIQTIVREEIQNLFAGILQHIKDEVKLALEGVKEQIQKDIKSTINLTQRLTTEDMIQSVVAHNTGAARCTSLHRGREQTRKPLTQL